MQKNIILSKHVRLKNIYLFLKIVRKIKFPSGRVLFLLFLGLFFLAPLGFDVFSIFVLCFRFCVCVCGGGGFVLYYNWDRVFTSKYLRRGFLKDDDIHRRLRKKLFSFTQERKAEFRYMGG